MATEWTQRTVVELAEAVRGGQVQAQAVAQEHLARIRERDPHLRAFIHVDPDTVLEAARSIDLRRERGESLGPLAGVPVAIKDSLCTRDAPTTCASRILQGRGGPWRPPYDATVVERLRAADALLVGKTNLDEFAMGSSTENSAWGPTVNPWDPGRVPGGSSGGSAVAVASRMAPAALGSDTGGSIRQPASLTHVVGIKPTYGRVSRYGLVAFASSLDQVGPLATDVRGAARVLGVIAGRDVRDATSAGVAVEDFEAACGGEVAGMRVGVPEEYFGEGLDDAVRERVREALEGLRSAGCTLHPVSLPHTRYAIATYYVVATAEASSNLARFDGVRFGSRVVPARGDLDGMYAATRGAGFGPEVKRRIMLGTYVLSAGYYDAYYLKAQRVRTLLRRDFELAFSQVDAIATPTSPTTAWKLGERTSNPLAMYLADAYTLPASLAGLPAIAVPCVPAPPCSDRPSLPVGLQLIGPSFGEASLCRLASAWERINPSAHAAPPGLVS